MKRWINMLTPLLGLGLGACTATPASNTPQAQPLSSSYIVHDRAASALVFDPPIATGQPPLMLARSVREPAAFVGYQDTTATWFSFRRDDWQMDGYPDQFTQRAISERVGVRYR